MKETFKTLVEKAKIAQSKAEMQLAKAYVATRNAAVKLKTEGANTAKTVGTKAKIAGAKVKTVSVDTAKTVGAKAKVAGEKVKTVSVDTAKTVGAKAKVAGEKVKASFPKKDHSEKTENA